MAFLITNYFLSGFNACEGYWDHMPESECGLFDSHTQLENLPANLSLERPVL